MRRGQARCSVEHSSQWSLQGRVLLPSCEGKPSPGIRNMTAPCGCLLRGERGDTAGTGGRGKTAQLQRGRSAVRLRIPSCPSRGDAAVMTSFVHDTAPTQYAEAGGIRFAYRRFGIPGPPPLVFFQHFMGTMDDHDPALSDAFASDREVILFNNAGVASSTGTVPGTIEAMARDAISFINALGLTTIDVVAHS